MENQEDHHIICREYLHMIRSNAKLYLIVLKSSAYVDISIILAGYRL